LRVVRASDETIIAQSLFDISLHVGYKKSQDVIVTLDLLGKQQEQSKVSLLLNVFSKIEGKDPR